MKIPSASKSQMAAKLLLDSEKLSEYEAELKTAQEIYSKSIQRAYEMTKGSYNDFCKASNYVAERYEQAVCELLKLYAKDPQQAV